MRSDAADNREKPARSPHVARRNAPPANAAAEASALLRLAFRLLPRLAQRQHLFEGLADLLQALLVHVVDALVALGAEVDHLVVVVHGWGYTRRKVRFKRGMQERRVFAT